MMDRSPGGVKRHLGPQMDRSPGGMKRHLAKQDSQKDVREQRFTAMANALIIPVRIKNAMVPMEKPDSRRRETRFEKQRQRPTAGDAVRELGGAFAPPPSPPVEDLRATRDFADPALRSQRDGKRRESTTFSHRYESVDMKKAMLHTTEGTVPFDIAEVNAPVTMAYDARDVLPGWISRHVDYGRVDQIIKEERLREALPAQPIIRTDKHIQLIDRFLVQVWPTAQRIGEARVSQVSRAARFHSCSRDEKIVEEGERGLTFFILVSGTAEVFKHSSPGKLATLKAGSSFAVSFGEASLGPGAPPRNATIVCSSDLAELLVLHKADYDQIMKDYQKSEHRKAFKCMKRIPLFRHWSRSRLDRLCDMLQWNYFKAGTVVVRQGDLPDNVYFILDGRCVVSKDVFVKRTNRWPSGKRSWVTKKVTETVNVRLLELDSGSYFGEKGILENTTRAATVAALVDSTIVSLDKVATRRRPPRANHEEVDVQAQIDNDTNRRASMATMLATGNLGARDMVQMADDLDGEGEPTEKNDGDESSEWWDSDEDDEDAQEKRREMVLTARWRDGDGAAVDAAKRDLDRALRDMRAAARARGVGLLDEKRDARKAAERTPPRRARGARGARRPTTTSAPHGTLSGPPRGVGGTKERRLPPVIRRHVHRANQRGHHRGLDEHLLDVICEHNMVEYNRKLLEKERAKAKLAILNDPNYVPDRGTGHVLHQPEMHYTQQHRDTSHDDVG
ncbi:cGMP-dependent protein kinase [Aureococcus anophagefferens]|nr:cGMP-dependent protein kinase [Aureococcus anophagefferens]